MNLSVVKSAVKTGAKYVVKHSPTILTVVGTCMMGGAIVKGVVESPKAKDELDTLDDNAELSHKDYLREKARILFYHYWSTAALGLGGAALIFWSHHVTLGQTATAIAAYNMKSDQLEKLEKKIVETDGEKHLTKMKEEIVKDDVSQMSYDDNLIHDTGKGKMLCIENITNKQFFHDIEKIRKACNDMNEEINGMMRGSMGDDTEFSLNEWFDYLGLPRCAIGNKLIWYNQLVDLNFTTALTEDGQPALVVGYKNAPIWDRDDSYCSDDWCERFPRQY